MGTGLNSYLFGPDGVFVPVVGGGLLVPPGGGNGGGLFVPPRGGGGGAQGGGGARDGGTGLSTIKHVLVNVVHHLFLRALQGEVGGKPVELHSDNSQEIVCNLYPWFLRRFFPMQAVPVGSIQPLWFRHTATGVAPPVVAVNAGRVFETHVQCANVFRDYVLRPLAVNPVRYFRDYWWEDVCHLGSYIQMWQLVVQLSQPREVMPLPKLSARVPDLVPGRVYPVRDMQHQRGVVCVYPRGMRFVLLGMHKPDEGETSWWALEPEAFQSVLEDNGIVVGPLVHRGNAAIRLGPTEDGTLERVGVLLPRDDGNDFEGIDFGVAADWKADYAQIVYPVDKRYFLSANLDGGYLYTDGEDEGVISEEHLEPILIGTTVYVKVEDAREVLGEQRVPANFNSAYVMFKLRYPDECALEPAENDKVYVVVDSPDGACVYGFSPDACFVDPVAVDSPEDEGGGDNDQEEEEGPRADQDKDGDKSGGEGEEEEARAEQEGGDDDAAAQA